MSTPFLNSVRSPRLLTARDVTNFEYVNINRDFSKTSDIDLEEAFLKLRTRCPETWTSDLEIRTRNLHEKFMALKIWGTERFIVPKSTSSDVKTDESEALTLINNPESWSMHTNDQAFEFSEILRHFTLFAPLEGRPFVRIWLEAITPCFSKWILVSDSEDTNVIDTLKKFLGAFGQPGIVVCLADKGASLLEILKYSARSVEALGRGTVEHHYWKSLTESLCGGDPGWQQLSSIGDKPLVRSQLDYLPQDWLFDATDWPLIFANLVSPEISIRFAEMINKAMIGNDSWVIKAGPPKTLDRTKSKGKEYREEFLEYRHSPRWINFAKKFVSIFKRVPTKPEDFVWNVVDFARCSICVPDAADVIKVWNIIQKQFTVICVKNSYNTKFKVKGSGYRDMKLLVEVTFDNLKLGGVPKVQPKTTLICEVQILCQKWLENKKSTSLSYKILRALTLRDLFQDAAKYVERKETDLWGRRLDAMKVLKNGWLNLRKKVDFSGIDVDEKLLKASWEGWHSAAITMLVKNLKANIETRDKGGLTALTLACRSGADDTARCLVGLKSNIESRNNYGRTALMFAANNGYEACVRILLNEKADINVKSDEGVSALEYAKRAFIKRRTTNFVRIVKLLRGEIVGLTRELGVKLTKIEELKNVLIEGSISLARYFDVQDVKLSHLSELLATSPGVASVSNLLQILWFGADIEYARNGWTPLLYAAEYGTSKTLNLLLQAGADVNFRGSYGESALIVAADKGSPAKVKIILEAKADLNVQTTIGFSSLHFAAKCGTHDLVQMLVKAKADVNARTSKGYSALHFAAKCGTDYAVQLLLKAEADVNAKTSNGATPLRLAVKYGSARKVAKLLKKGANFRETCLGRNVQTLALQNMGHQESILKVLANHPGI